MGLFGKYATKKSTIIKEQMQKKLLLIFIMMATWMVVSCTTTSQEGCYGYWEDNRWGMKRGTIAGKNADYKKPYRQCVDEEDTTLNKEKRPYG
tara:strand:+ start:181 stop:459 length:279 start_codon:yes stop_codon:yes gene_type:complete